jgi:hypothetical protein
MKVPNLAELLQKNRLFLEPDGKGGHQLFFVDEDLAKVVLRGAKPRGAKLSEKENV